MSSAQRADVTIREARESDTQTIIDLIRELAIYEKEPQEAKATPELVKENIFDKKYAHCLIAESEVDGQLKAVGIAIVSSSGSHRERNLRKQCQAGVPLTPTPLVHGDPPDLQYFFSLCVTAHLVVSFFVTLTWLLTPYIRGLPPSYQLDVDMPSVIVPGRPLRVARSTQSRRRQGIIQASRVHRERAQLRSSRLVRLRLERPLHRLLHQGTGGEANGRLDRDAPRRRRSVAETRASWFVVPFRCRQTDELKAAKNNCSFTRVGRCLMVRAESMRSDDALRVQGRTAKCSYHEPIKTSRKNVGRFE